MDGTKAKKSNVLKCLASMMVAILLFSCIFPMFSTADASNGSKQTLKVAILSDTHYIPSSMINKNNPEFKKALNSDRKLLAESESILDSALDLIQKDKPEVLLIPGDLTKDGEKEAHKEVAKRLEDFQAKLKEQNINTKIYLINGNHDINNSHAMDYSGTNTAIKAEKTSVADFRKIYKNICYNDEIEQYSSSNVEKAGCLSYVVRPKDGFTIIAVDSCKYSPDNTTSKKSEHETSGAISPDLMKWIKKQSKKAKKRGDQIILIQHHGVVPHYEAESLLTSAYLVDDYEKVGVEYAKSGIRYVLTGHMHANDISQLNNTDYGSGYELTDIETGSSITYPSPFRKIVFTNDKTNKKESADIKTDYIKEIDYLDENGNKITDLQSYGKKVCHLSSNLLSTAPNGVLEKAFEDINTNGSSIEEYMNYWGSTLFNQDDMVIKDYIISILPKILPTTPQEALNIDIASKLKAKVYYDIPGERIRLIGVLTSDIHNLKMFDLSITNEALKETISDLFLQADKTIVKDPNQIYNLNNKLATAIMNMTVYEKNGVKKTAFDLSNEIYLSHLSGQDKEAKDWVQETLNNTDELSEKLIKTIVKTAYPDSTKILNNFKIDLDKLISKTNKSAITDDTVKLIHEIIREDDSLVIRFGLYLNTNNLKDIISNSNSAAIDKLLSIFGKKVPTGTLANLIMNEEKSISFITKVGKAKLSDTIYQVGYTMANDTNYPQDNNTQIIHNKLSVSNQDFIINEPQKDIESNKHINESNNSSTEKVEDGKISDTDRIEDDKISDINLNDIEIKEEIINVKNKLSKLSLSNLFKSTIRMLRNRLQTLYNYIVL